MKLLPIFTIIALTISCKNKAHTPNPLASLPPIQTSQTESGLKKAYFASGCFWCVEAIFESVKGVEEVVSGYSGGREKNPTYKQVGYGKTTHAEAVEIFYNPKVVSFKTLVNVFFGSHDPTTKNRQGPDKGIQYRSIAFFQNEKEKEIINTAVTKLNKEVFNHQITTEVLPFQKFWVAETYHQNYEQNHPNNPYIQNVSIPRLNRFKAKFPDLIKENH